MWIQNISWDYNRTDRRVNREASADCKKKAYNLCGSVKLLQKAILFFSHAVDCAGYTATTKMENQAAKHVDHSPLLRFDEDITVMIFWTDN